MAVENVKNVIAEAQSLYDIGNYELSIPMVREVLAQELEKSRIDENFLVQCGILYCNCLMGAKKYEEAVLSSQSILLKGNLNNQNRIMFLMIQARALQQEESYENAATVFLSVSQSLEDDSLVSSSGPFMEAVNGVCFCHYKSERYIEELSYLDTMLSKKYPDVTLERNLLMLKASFLSDAPSFTSSQKEIACECYKKVYDMESELAKIRHDDARMISMEGYCRCLVECGNKKEFMSFMEDYLALHDPRTMMQKTLTLYLECLYEDAQYFKMVELEKYRISKEEDSVSEKLKDAHEKVGE